MNFFSIGAQMRSANSIPSRSLVRKPTRLVLVFYFIFDYSDSHIVAYRKHNLAIYIVLSVDSKLSVDSEFPRNIIQNFIVTRDRSAHQ